MRDFTDTELERMRDTQETAMQDLGYIQDYSPTTSYGEEKPAWVERTDPVPVGVEMKSSQERRTAELDILLVDGKLRLPLGTQVEKRDRVRVTQRYNQDITEMIVAIEGTPQEGSSGLIVDFKIVDPGLNR